ncbi:hypothetical protein V1515DRAFT_617775 [Lipomyces mesembrius]
MVYTARWGIVATGWISARFFVDLLVDPSTRGVTDVVHTPVAVASRFVAKAEKFIADFGNGVPGVKAYGSYAELFADTNVDIVYVGTPHSSHYEDSLQALRAGKHVLCEKAFTINAAQARHLADYAKSHKLFLMEALLHEEKIVGNILRVTSDLAHRFVPDVESRLYNPYLGGCALLDVGTPLTGVDESTVITMVWDKPHIISTATCSIAVDSPEDCLVRVQGDLGEIIVPISTANPTEFIVKIYATEQGKEDEVNTFRDVRDGTIVDDIYPAEESAFVMEMFDEVRRQNDFVYPAEIEFVEYE